MSSNRDGYRVALQRRTLTNSAYRRVLYTAPKPANVQLVLMCLQPGEEIGWERHSRVTQFVRVEQGKARVNVGSKRYLLGADDAVIIPAGKRHNVTNIGQQELKLYTLYSKAEHRPGTVQQTKPDPRQ